jgi:hypothetical protein
MSCDVIRNRLLALPDPAGVPADLRAHLDGCDPCRRYLDRYLLLNAELAALPAPPGGDAKAAFLDSLTAAGPVIKSIPTLPARTGSGSWRAVARRVPLGPAAGLAAAVVVGVGLWANRGGPKPVQADPGVGTRHELLARVVALDGKLARAGTVQERIPLLTDMAAALATETGGVYLAARTKDDTRSLADMFDRVVRDGIVKQAGKFREEDRLVPAAERHRVLTAAIDALTAAAAETTAMVRSAPPQVKEDLERMAKRAEDGRQALLRLREGT